MSALLLKIIACLTMLLDHVGYFWGIYWLRIVGRIAFPIFVYMIYNGYRHTSSKWKYALRLAFFAVATQIPFNLFMNGSLWRGEGNVFFTLLAALLCLWSVDVMWQHKVLHWFSWLPPMAVCALYLSHVITSDYDAIGVLMILVFYFCDRKGIAWKLLTVIGFLAAVFHGYLLSCAKALVLAAFVQPLSLPPWIFGRLPRRMLFCPFQSFLPTTAKKARRRRINSWPRRHNWASTCFTRCTWLCSGSYPHYKNSSPCTGMGSFFLIN